MQHDEARRYSRSDGLSWCDRVTGTPGSRSASTAATCSSWAGLTIDHSRQTATASTPAAFSRSAMSCTEAATSGRTMRPSAPIRSSTSKVSERGT